jgi:hypothetical protein
MQQTDSRNFQQERCPTCHSGLTCPICKQIAYGILSEDVLVSEKGASIQSPFLLLRWVVRPLDWMMSPAYPVIRVFWIFAVLVEVSLDLQSCMRWTEKNYKRFGKNAQLNTEVRWENAFPPRQNKDQEKDDLQIYHMLFLNLCLIHDINKHWICHVSPIPGYQKHWTCHENEYFVSSKKQHTKAGQKNGCHQVATCYLIKIKGRVAGGGLVAWHMPGCERSIWGGLCIQLCFAPNCGGRLSRDPEQKQSKNPKP